MLDIKEIDIFDKSITTGILATETPLKIDVHIHDILLLPWLFENYNYGNLFFQVCYPQFYIEC